MIDWVKESANGDSVHFAEPRHSTEAITAAAEESIVAALTQEAPLFLYVSFTAAHSPLQPIERHLHRCSHIPHLWRRKFCGMVVGLDEGVRNITETALRYLGNNTIVVITSDNGGNHIIIWKIFRLNKYFLWIKGSPWFGGLNAPLRGGKSNPFEGGVRVPAVFLDFSSDPNQKLGSFHGLTHVSDWFPTLASLAGVPARSLPADIDGVSIAHHLSPARRISDGLEASGDECKSEARDGVLLEMWEEYDTPFGESLEAYRWKDFKFINGSVRDPNHYCESLTGYFLNISNPMWISYSVELLSKGLEAIYGVGRSDSLRIILTHQVVQVSQFG